MKNIFFLMLSSAIIFSACKKNYDYAFDTTPDARISKALADYEAKLAGAQYGWKALITVDSGKGATYSFYFKFDNKNRVTMVSDFDSASAVTPKESSFRLKAQQQLTLIFDTYSYVHVLADPNENVVIFANVNGGPTGEGLLSDFEFIFDNSQIKEDTIRMNGKVHGSKLVMIRATKAESDQYLGGQFVLFSGFLDSKILTYFKRAIIAGVLYDITVNGSDRTIMFTWIDSGGNPRSFTTTYYNTLGGITFKAPLVNGAQTVTGFANAVWDAGTSTLNFSASGQASTMTPIVIPLYVDKTAGSRWWQYGNDNGSYWISFQGFHVNGVDDGYNIRSLPGYYYLIYWPAYAAANDLFAPVFLNAAQTGLELRYGAAPRKPTTTTDGRTVFTLLGNYGTYPATGPARESRNQLLITEGHYFVQVGPTAYDMVSAKDGKVWVRWEW